MSEEAIAQARRLYLHVKEGGSVTAIDMSRIVKSMEDMQAERDRLRQERDRLAADLAQAHRDILPWIEQVGHLNAAWDTHTHALRSYVDKHCENGGDLCGRMSDGDCLGCVAKAALLASAQ